MWWFANGSTVSLAVEVPGPGFDTARDLAIEPGDRSGRRSNRGQWQPRGSGDRAAPNGSPRPYHDTAKSTVNVSTPSWRRMLVGVRPLCGAPGGATRSANPSDGFVATCAGAIECSPPAVLPRRPDAWLGTRSKRDRHRVWTPGERAVGGAVAAAWASPHCWFHIAHHVRFGGDPRRNAAAGRARERGRICRQPC